MTKRNICENCVNKDVCIADCEALFELSKEYKRLRISERQELIKRLRKILNISDAEVDKDLEVLGNKIINKLSDLQFIKDFGIRIGYVKSYEAKRQDGKTIYADCRKIGNVYGAYLPFDFIITFYEPNIAILNENQIKILMWHELKHIGIGQKGLKIEPHDIEDFYIITDIASTRWNEFNKEVLDILG